MRSYALEENARMASGFWASRQKKRGKIQQESFNRDKHWTRKFSVRTECWPIVEHWANEYDYHLIAIRGKRRLYQKGYPGSLYVTNFDIRQEEGHVILAAWIVPSFLTRALSFFTMPKELKIDPRGHSGIVKRRRICREMNALLERFKQNSIHESTGIHWADLDPTTLILAGALGLPLFIFLAGTVNGFEIRPGLVPLLLAAVGRPLAWLTALAAAVVLLHQSLALNRLKTLPLKAISAGSIFVLYTVLTLVVTSRTTWDMTEAKVTFHCVQKYKKEVCEGILGRLSIKQRTHVLEKLQQLEKELTAKDASNSLGNVR